MIAHIQGILSEINSDSVVIDAGGVGYELGVSAQTIADCPQVGDKLKLYTHMVVREDAMELYGFSTRDEKRMFLRLIGVSGIGPRTAIGILSALNVHELSLALVTGDTHVLAKAPGIGKKTAQRLVLELKDKVEDTELTGRASYVGTVSKPKPMEAEAIEALMALGYPSNEAARAVNAVAGQADNVNDLVFKALRTFG